MRYNMDIVHEACSAILLCIIYFLFDNFNPMDLISIFLCVILFNLHRHVFCVWMIKMKFGSEYICNRFQCKCILNERVYSLHT